MSSGLLPVNPMRFVVRSSLPTATVVPAVRRAIGDLDPAQAVHDVAEVNAIVRDSTSLERIGSFMMTFFALAALLMATLGIYGVVSVLGAPGDGGARHADGARGGRPRPALPRDRQRLEDGRLRRGDWRGRGGALVRPSGEGISDRRSRRAAIRGLDRHRRADLHGRVFLSCVARDQALTDGRDSKRARDDVAGDARDTQANAQRLEERRVVP